MIVSKCLEFENSFGEAVTIVKTTKPETWLVAVYSDLTTEYINTNRFINAHPDEYHKIMEFLHANS